MRLIPLVFTCFLPALHGADVAERPLYMALEWLPTDFESTVESPNGTFRGEDSVPNLGLAIGLRWSFAPAGWTQGPVLGTEIAGESASFDDGSHRAVELRGLACWAVAINREWLAQVGVRGGYGLSRLEMAVSGGSDISASGTGWSMEPNIEVLWGINERARLSLGLGWRTSSYEYSDGDLDISLSNDGLAARLGLEWQLSVAPQRLR